MQVIERAHLSLVGGGTTAPGGTAPSVSTSNGVIYNKWSLPGGGMAILTCTTYSASLGLSLVTKGKLATIKGDGNIQIPGCKITTIDKNGNIKDQKSSDAGDLNDDGVDIAESGDISMDGFASDIDVAAAGDYGSWAGGDWGGGTGGSSGDPGSDGDGDEGEEGDDDDPTNTNPNFVSPGRMEA